MLDQLLCIGMTLFTNLKQHHKDFNNDFILAIFQSCQYDKVFVYRDLNQHNNNNPTINRGTCPRHTCARPCHGKAALRAKARGLPRAKARGPRGEAAALRDAASLRAAYNLVIIISKTMFMVLSSWQSHCESSPGHLMNVEWRQAAAADPRPSQTT